MNWSVRATQILDYYRYLISRDRLRSRDCVFIFSRISKDEADLVMRRRLLRGGGTPAYANQIEGGRAGPTARTAF